jgi:hypothetical protein
MGTFFLLITYYPATLLRQALGEEPQFPFSQHVTLRLILLSRAARALHCFYQCEEHEEERMHQLETAALENAVR